MKWDMHLDDKKFKENKNIIIVKSRSCLCGKQRSDHGEEAGVSQVLVLDLDGVDVDVCFVIARWTVVLGLCNSLCMCYSSK